MCLQTCNTVATLNPSDRAQLPYKERPHAAPGAQTPTKTQFPPKLSHRASIWVHCSLHHSLHHTIQRNQRSPLCGPQPLPTLMIWMLDAQAQIKTRLPPKLSHRTMASSHMHHSIHHTIKGNQWIPLCGPQPLPTMTIRMLDASRGFYVFVGANPNDIGGK